MQLRLISIVDKAKVGGWVKSNRDGFMGRSGKTVKQGVLRARLGTACYCPWLEERNQGRAYRAGVQYPRRQQLGGRLRGKPTPSQHDAGVRRARLVFE